MKILVSNYSNQYHTEPLYLNASFNIAGCQSTLWPNKVSTFDIFDIVHPDVHITHHTKLTLDLAMYLKESKNIDLMINITGLNQSEVLELEQKFIDYNIKPKLFFINYNDHNIKTKHTNIMTLLHGCDIFLNETKSIKAYSIQYGIFVNSQKQLSPIGKTYHYLANDNNLTSIADICLPEYELSRLFGNYDNIVFKYFDKIIPQAFYDAAYYSKGVYFDIENRSALDLNLQKLFGDGVYCNLSEQSSGNIKKKVESKHTCLHRAKSILSQLSSKSEIDKLQVFIEEILK